MSARDPRGLHSLPWDHFGPEDDRFDAAELAHLASLADLHRRFPRADTSVVPYLRDLLAMAESYHFETGRHLDIYDGIGALFAAVVYGLGPDETRRDTAGLQRFGVCTVGPPRNGDAPLREVATDRLDALVVVRIAPAAADDTFQISGRLIGRDVLPASADGTLLVGWDGLSLP